MAEPILTWKNSTRANDRVGSLTELLDKVFGTQAGAAVWRGADGWALSPIRYEVVSLAGVVSTSGGGIAAWQPSGGFHAVITRCVVYVRIPSTGAANLSVGMGSSSTTSYTNLITATSVAAAGILDSITSQTTATAAVALDMPISNYVTFSGSASTAGLVGSALIEYWQA